MTDRGSSTRSVPPVQHPEQLFIGGEWVRPSSDDHFDVIDSNDEELYYRVAAAGSADMARAVDSARGAFDSGPWPQLDHAERAGHLRAMADELRARSPQLADLWPRESGILSRLARGSGVTGGAILDGYADLAESFIWEERVPTTNGEPFGMLIREPVGVVGAIVPWNGPLSLALYKLAPALLAGCTVVLKASPEAPGALYIIAEAAEAAGLPPGVLNVLTAGREVSAELVADRRVDKISFTGSTEAGRRIASALGERIGRYTLELGGKSAAVILSDADLVAAAESIAGSSCILTGQVCASLTRLIISRDRHDDFVSILADAMSRNRVGHAFDPRSDMGPLASADQRDRVERLIARAIAEGAPPVLGGRRPPDQERGYFLEPTLFDHVDNQSTLARTEVFGPVLAVVPARDDDHAVALANESIYGLNASVFTADASRAQSVARRLRSGTVGHNGSRVDYGIGFGGFKQSGVGREGGVQGLAPYLETKTLILREAPSAESPTSQPTTR